MTLLDAHLDQIELCSQTIAELPFPPPKVFTNALLNCPDITALIRDTETHERALFSLAPLEQQPTTSSATHNRRTTTFGADKVPRKQSAVAAVLGGDLAERIRRERVRESQLSRRGDGRQKDDIDVEILLKGAERLCSIYPVAGATNRIAALRARNDKVMASIEQFEDLAVDQMAQLNQLNRSTSINPDDNDPTIDLRMPSVAANMDDLPMTQQQLLEEEESIAELERKKKTLEERVNSMEKDLGGLMR